MGSIPDEVLSAIPAACLRHAGPAAARPLGWRRHAGDAALHSNDNLTTERKTFVTHLECSATGEHYAADEIHNLSRAGKPLAGALRSRRREKGAEQGRAGAAAAGPVALSRASAGAAHAGHRQPRRGDDADRAAAEACRQTRRRRTSGQGRRPVADRFVQGARPGHGGVDGQGARHQAHGDADQRQCRCGACRLCQPCRHQDHDLLSRGYAGSQCQRDRSAGRRASIASTA